ncbi:hypothetical protein [Thiofilum flexile]|uniref:hypothetical protein n=1 Tax=Thiofilum flexile TaxID=125627 RepID=UPI0003651893|nr:hypothetical protein [Thiofilum flexile]
MKELEQIREQTERLSLPNSKNKPRLYINIMLPYIEQALQIGVFKKDIWRILVELGIFGKNSYPSFLIILKKAQNNKAEPEAKPVLAAKTPVANKPEPKKEEAKPKTEPEKKPHEPIWATDKDAKPSFVYNPIPDPSKLF